MSVEELKETYSNQSTDRLLFLKARGGLSDEAEEAMESVLSTRELSEDDLQYAEKAVAIQQQEINDRKAMVKNYFRRRLINIGVVVLILLVLIITDKIF